MSTLVDTQAVARCTLSSTDVSLRLGMFEGQDSLSDRVKEQVCDPPPSVRPSAVSGLAELSLFLRSLVFLVSSLVPLPRSTYLFIILFPCSSSMFITWRRYMMDDAT